MFTNRNGCTIYEKTTHNRAPTYIRHTTGAVYVETVSAQRNGSDRKPDNEIFISIPADHVTYVPKTDDRIVCGIIEDEQPPAKAMAVITVKDFRYGSPFVKHIEVTAK